MTNRLGQQLGNYSLIRLLGEGGFAEVYLGEHIYLKTQAAIKVLQTRLASEDSEGFLKEARTIAGLKHPHIIRILDFGIEAGTPFLVMDYAPHGTLRKRHPKGEPLQLVTILNYVKQVAPALQYAHERKLVHRDVKPENLLLGENNELLLSDFGIALVTQSSRYQSTQEVVGTVAYMAPEQLQGKPRRASDQYALGIIVYEWLCGDRPFHGTFTELFSQHLFVPPPPLREKVTTILPAVEQVVLTALEKDPDKRFASVQDFANALETACGEVLAFPTPDSDSLTEPRSDRNSAALGTILLETLNQATPTPGSMRQSQDSWPGSTPFISQPSVMSDTFTPLSSLTSETSEHTPATNGPKMPLPQMLPSSSEALPVTHPVLPPPPKQNRRRRNVVVASVSLLLVVALLLGAVLSRNLASRTSTHTSTPPTVRTNTTAIAVTSTVTNSPTITPTPSPPSAYPTPSISGYIFSGTGLTGLKAKWNIPNFTTTGAFGDQAVIGIQLGCWSGNTPSDCLRLFIYVTVGTDNSSSIVATYAYYTPSQVTANLSLTVSPGDVILASMEYTASNARPWALTMTDQTRGGQTAQVSLSNSTSRANAIFYVGNVYDSTTSRYFPLPKFGPVTFQNVELRFDAGWVGLSTQQYQPVDLVQNTSTLLQASPLNGESFTVTRLNS